MPDPVTSAVTTAVVSAGANKILGGSGGGGGSARPATREEIQSQLSNLPSIEVPSIFPSVGLNTPNFSFSGGGGQFSLNRTRPSVALDTFDKRIPGFFGNIDDLRSRFRPGFSEIRDARMGATTAARQRGLSNLRDSLSRRRVQGSSFARDEEVRAQREFGQMEAEQQAQSFLEEVAINNQLLEIENQAFQQLTNRALVDIEQFKAAAGLTGTFAQAGVAGAQLGLQAQLGELEAMTNIIQSLNGLSSTNAQLQTQLDIANAQGLGNFAGTLAEGFINQEDSGPTTTSGAGQQSGPTTTSGGGQRIPRINTSPTTTGNIAPGLI